MSDYAIAVYNRKGSHNLFYRVSIAINPDRNWAGASGRYLIYKEWGKIDGTPQSMVDCEVDTLSAAALRLRAVLCNKIRGGYTLDLDGVTDIGYPVIDVDSIAVALGLHIPVRGVETVPPAFGEWLANAKDDTHVVQLLDEDTGPKSFGGAMSNIRKTHEKKQPKIKCRRIRTGKRKFK